MTARDYWDHVWSLPVENFLGLGLCLFLCGCLIVVTWRGIR